MIFTLAKVGLVMTPLSDELVRIENTTSHVTPIFFYVAPREFSLRGFAQTIKSLIGGS